MWSILHFAIKTFLANLKKTDECKPSKHKKGSTIFIDFAPIFFKNQHILFHNLSDLSIPRGRIANYSFFNSSVSQPQQF